MAKAPTSTPADHVASLRRPAGDPPTRADGRCYVCLGERGRVAVKHDDPFCKSDCARSFHGSELAAVVPGGRPRGA